ncbi:MAG: hypothetical protein WDO69_11615 [Pseudomonadota bacterium]
MALSSRLFLACALVLGAPACGGQSPPDAGGHPDAGSGVTPTFLPEGALRACVFAGACISPLFAAQGSPPIAAQGAHCVYQLERARILLGGLERFASCAQAATSCTEVFSCVSRDHGPDYCLAHPGRSCDGSISVSCPTTPTSAWAIDPPSDDCEADGLICTGAGLCTNGNTCTHWPIVLNCYDNKLTTCGLIEPMWESELDCATVYPGGRCGGFNQSPACLPREADVCPWVTQSPYGCSGNVLQGCDTVAKATLDCDTLDSDCHVDNFGHATCDPRAQECTQDSPDHCIGSALSICVDGRYRDVDCAALALGPCHPTPEGGAVCGSPN